MTRHGYSQKHNESSKRFRLRIYGLYMLLHRATKSVMRRLDLLRLRLVGVSLSYPVTIFLETPKTWIRLTKDLVTRSAPIQARGTPGYADVALSSNPFAGKFSRLYNFLSDLSDAALFVLPKIFKLRTMFRARHTSGTSPVATFLYDQSRFSSKELEHDKTPFNQPNCGRYMQISRPKRLSSLSCCRQYYPGVETVRTASYPYTEAS